MVVDQLANQPSLHVAPELIDLGIVYQGSIMEGAFSLPPVKVIKSLHIDADATGCAILDLYPMRTYSDGSRLWPFRVNTEHPGVFLVCGEIHTDLGIAYPQITYRVCADHSENGKVLLCQSPFVPGTSLEVFRNLKLMMADLRIQMDATNQLPHDLFQYRMMILHGSALNYLLGNERNRLEEFLRKGGRLVILADHFCKGTVMKANHLVEGFGIWLHDREYDEVTCTHRQIVPHPLTRGVQQLYLYRCTPLQAFFPGKLLIANPDQPKEGFMACSGPYDNLLVIGLSRLSRLLTIGWPFDNGRLLANVFAAQN
jgi:hypothetical protein